MLFSKIISTGSFVPPRVVPNLELEKILGTTDSWIREKIGIEERRYVDKGVGTSDLALEASRKALSRAGLKPSDLDAIIVATATPDYNAPGVGVLLQDKLGCENIPAFDVHNTSPGFLFALELADGLIRSRKYETILVCGAEVHSTALDFSPRGRLMSVIFGDGAGAVILKVSNQPGIIATELHSEGKHFDKLWCEAPASRENPRLSDEMIRTGKIYPTMDGRFVFENAVKCMGQASVDILKKNQLEVKDLDWVIPHQANLRIIETLAQKLSIPTEKIALTISKYGNTSSASIPITLDEMVEKGRLQKNHKILMTSFGSGFSWGSCLAIL